jgi:TFIIF-interacting CTD phosphatase-like protein
MVNIVLDLDETLIHTIVSDRPRPDLERSADFKFRFSNQGPIYYVYKRPGLKQFLAEVFRRFKRIGVWTAADRQYAKAVIKNILTYQQIMNLDFVFSRDFCEIDHIGFVKPLTKIFKQYPAWRPEETIVLDNSSQVMKENPRNGIQAIDYDSLNLHDDIYLYLLTDIFKKNLPKYRIYQFVDRVNNVIAHAMALINNSNGSIPKKIKN